MRCYQGVALALGGILMTGLTSLNSCSFGTLRVFAAEDALSGEMMVAFQEEVVAEEENVETDILTEETNTQEINTQEATVQEVPVMEPQPVVNSAFSLEQQEYEVLLKIVEAEAGGEDTAGKMLVANVVMNRVRSSRFPNTVSEVVYQRSGGRAQFSPTVDGRLNAVSISADTVEAVSRVMNGEDLSGGALYFRSVRSRSGWFDRALNRVVEHGNHIFYSM